MLRRLVPSRALGVLLLLSLAARAASLGAQSPAGSIGGRVTDAMNLPLSGVSVAIQSDSLQGSQKTTTSTSGDYLIKLLPPGRYRVTFTMPAFAPMTKALDVSAMEPVRLDATLQPATVTDTVTVAADSRAFLGTIANATNIKQSLIAELPTNRTMVSSVALAPAVHATGPDGAYSLAGGMSFDNIFLLNGVRIQDNLRGTPFNLFIEDAIQETTVSTSGISAEYGGFGGGVVNTVTKSGGNALAGSFRASFANDSWRTATPFGEPKINKTVPTYEYTLGGPIVRDRLWFFASGRASDQREARQTGYSDTPYEYADNEKRFEGKLTGAFTPAQRLTVAYTGVREKQINNAYPDSTLVMDVASLTTRQLPQNLLAINYAGTFGTRFFVEGQYSARSFSYENDGGRDTDRVRGTPLKDQTTEAFWWAPNFCGVCVDEERDNSSAVLKGTYFLSSGTGSHALTFGYDTFNDRMTADNHQSASDYHVWATGSVIDNGVVYPVIEPGFSTYIIHWPLATMSRGTNYRSHALFVNDGWTVNRHLSFNLGVRFDKNSGKDASGQLVANDAEISPRLGVAWDLGADGETTITASAGRYVSSVSNSVASKGTGAGTPSILGYFYDGAPINTTGGGALVPSDEALRRVFSWYDEAQPSPFFVDIPGVASRVDGSLQSPYADAYSVGIGQQLGTRGSVRIDYVLRTFGNFYANRVDRTTGTAEDSFGQVFDLKLIQNTNDLTRDYRALDMHGRYRFGDRVTIGGSYTVSRLSGNVDGETSQSGPVASSVLTYPEYFERRWRYPEGDLSADQRHRARVWGTIALPSFGLGQLSLGVIQQAQSGTPYGALGEVVVSPFVDNPGYMLAPDTNAYFFTSRDAFRTKALVKTDVSLNFTRRLGLGSEAFAQFQLFNVFNRFQVHNIGAINTTVLTAINDSDRFAVFDPFTETPVQGVHWDYGRRFGQAIGQDAYTQPRTFRFSAGVRF